MKENRKEGNGKEASKKRERRKKGKLHTNEIWEGYTNESKVEEKGKKKQRYRKGKGKKRRIEGIQK